MSIQVTVHNTAIRITKLGLIKGVVRPQNYLKLTNIAAVQKAVIVL